MLHRGTVIDNVDPTDTFRLKVKVPTLTGGAVVEAWPILQAGSGQELPAPGTAVWVAQAGNTIVWLGVWTPVGESASEYVEDGTAGTGPWYHLHEQGPPLQDWPINHGGGLFPAGCVVEDSAGGIQEPEWIEYVDLDNVILHFRATFGGRAILS